MDWDKSYLQFLIFSHIYFGIILTVEAQLYLKKLRQQYLHVCGH